MRLAGQQVVNGRGECFRVFEVGLIERKVFRVGKASGFPDQGRMQSGGEIIGTFGLDSVVPVFLAEPFHVFPRESLRFLCSVLRGVCNALRVVCSARFRFGCCVRL